MECYFLRFGGNDQFLQVGSGGTWLPNVAQCLLAHVDRPLIPHVGLHTLQDGPEQGIQARKGHLNGFSLPCDTKQVVRCRHCQSCPVSIILDSTCHVALPWMVQKRLNNSRALAPVGHEKTKYEGGDELHYPGGNNWD